MEASKNVIIIHVIARDPVLKRDKLKSTDLHPPELQAIDAF
jgi:hypothetical protein